MLDRDIARKGGPWSRQLLWQRMWEVDPGETCDLVTCPCLASRFLVWFTNNRRQTAWPATYLQLRLAQLSNVSKDCFLIALPCHRLWAMFCELMKLFHCRAVAPEHLIGRRQPSEGVKRSGKVSQASRIDMLYVGEA